MVFQSYSYIFLVTYGRSGSTLLQSLLNSLDGIQIRGENYSAPYHLGQAIQMVNETKARSRQRLVQNPDEPWYGAGQVRPLMFRNALLEAFVTHVLRPDEGVKQLGFKEIRHMPTVMNRVQFTNYMDFLLDNFPDAKIVFNTRNSDSVAKSGWFAKLDPQTTKDQIRECDDRFACYNASSDRTILMHYDDYVADHSLIKQLFAFVGHDYDAEMVDAIFAKPLEHKP